MSSSDSRNEDTGGYSKETSSRQEIKQVQQEVIQPQPGSPIFDPSLIKIRPELLPPKYDDPESLLVFDWISSAWNTTGTSDGGEFRRQRRFLEQHPELLRPKSDEVLQDMIAQASGDAMQVWLFRKQRNVLYEARLNGGTVEAIRTAYINVYSGTALDLPQWLETAMQQLNHLEQGQPDQTATARAMLLRDCISRVENDSAIPKEVRAELYALLGRALRTNEGADRRGALEAAIAAYEVALQTYTYHHYPQRYADIQYSLGLVYANRMEGSWEENREQAIQCYEEALRVYTYEEFPYEWANVQSHLASVYAMLERGGKIENRERAIQYYEAALQVVAFDTFPEIWANTQCNLGDLYLERTEGDKTKNLERAIQYITAALRYFTREKYSFKWAMAQNYLGTAYLERIEGDQARNIEIALRCFQASLRVVTRETLPLDWVDAQRGLGNAYRKRTQGDAAENSELAIQHLTAALEAMDPTLFRVKWLKTHNDLGEAYRNRVQGDRKENLRQARIHHQTVLESMPPNVAERQRAQLNLTYLAALRYLG